MSIDARDAAEFYATTLGGLTASLLRRRLTEIWPDCSNLSCLGLGYTGPFLRQWREQATRTIAVSPHNFGNAVFPAGRASLSCTAEEDALPFPDLSFDRILLVHGLEHAGNARQTLREVWRLLKDDGRLIVVVPNRQGMWAYWENSPFGYGQPYSKGQLARLLSSLFFQVEHQSSALSIPPINWRLMLRTFDLCERLGATLAPQFAGLTIAEATKDMLAIMPIKRQPSRRRVLVDASN
jgi:SAM-dependent methyltransferase